MSLPGEDIVPDKMAVDPMISVSAAIFEGAAIASERG